MNRGLPLALLVALSSSACSTDPAGGDDVGPDSAQHQAMTIDVTSSCQPHVREEKLGNVLRFRRINKYAVVNNVGPDDDFAVTTCGVTYLTPIEACPAGFTCTGSTGLAGEQCSSSGYRAGNFVDGRLTILCGQSSESFDASGAQTSRSGFDYTSIKVTVY